MKTCSQCGEIKPLSKFYHRDKKKTKYFAECKKCHAWRSRVIKYRIKYGLSLDDVRLMYEDQLGQCAICKRSMRWQQVSTRQDSFHVDHCHVSGRVRGLLCKSCNNGLGHFEDKAQRLRDAADYLERDHDA